MQNTIAHSLKEWQTFYVLLGTVSATLLGLLFVTLSFGSGEIYKGKTPVVLKIFVNPVYYQFLTVLVIAILMIIPTQSTTSLSVLLLVVVVYNAFEQIKRLQLVFKFHFTNLKVRIFTVVFPMLCSLTTLLAALFFLFSVKTGLFLLSLVSIFLLLLGIGNTWQIMTGIMEHRSNELNEKKGKSN